jgi:transposase
MGSDQKIERERRWREHLAGWKSSGVSQAAYCHRQGLTQNDFSWWKRELARRDARTAAATTKPAFVPVRVVAQQRQDYPFELALRGGRVLRFEAGVDAAALRAVLEALEQERAAC